MKKASVNITTEGYDSFLNDLKVRIRSAQVKALLSVNRELVQLYWSIGKSIVEQQENAGWGKAVVENLAKDLKNEFPEVKGLSSRNLWDMRRFYEAYRHHSNLRQVVAEIPWGHNLLLLNKVRDPAVCEWYVLQTIENGWSRTVLQHQIESDLYNRQVQAPKTNNFLQTLPPLQSELVQQAFKDTYVFDFLALGPQVLERDIEVGLLNQVEKFLLELGRGFALLGRQFHMEVGGQDYYIDLLFYHYVLRCLVAIDLKIEEFKPEFAGKMNFYLAALDDQVKNVQDQPSIGIILCKEKNNTIVEYALRDMSKPIGVSAYQLSKYAPVDIRDSLPTPAEFEKALRIPMFPPSDPEEKEKAHQALNEAHMAAGKRSTESGSPAMKAFELTFGRLRDFECIGKMNGGLSLEDGTALFLKCAEIVGIKVPESFQFEEGQIFSESYNINDVQEVRLRGKVTKIQDGVEVIEQWSTPVVPEVIKNSGGYVDPEQIDKSGKSQVSAVLFHSPTNPQPNIHFACSLHRPGVDTQPRIWSW